MYDLRMEPMGYHQITSLGSAVGLPSIPEDADVVLLQAEAQNVRFRDDGTAPTATVGMLLVAGAEPFQYMGALEDLKVIQATSGGILNVSYYMLAG